MITTSKVTSTVAAALLLASMGAGAASAQTSSATDASQKTSATGTSATGTSATGAAGTSSSKSTSAAESSSSVTTSPGTTPAAEISTEASASTGEYLQSGTVVDDVVNYTGLVKGEKYRLEASLMCKETSADTKAKSTHEFTASDTKGSETVSGIEVTDPDCHEQVVFEKLYDSAGKMVATHEDFEDAAQTVGGKDMLKKKKKESPAASSSAAAPSSSAPTAKARANADAKAPSGGRQLIASVPSGSHGDYGIDLFHR